MSQELHYTSVPRGLKPGTRGFCTVAVTPQMSGPLVDRLENLSGYQPVYPAHDPAAVRNPVNFSHVRFSLAGRSVSILSRVGPAGLDYTGRANKYAHHIVLDSAERPYGGPAWLLDQPGFIQAAWDGEPRMLADGRPVPHGDRPGGIATAWASLTGDAGWAGVLAEAFLSDANRPAFVVFRPGMDLLPLFTEAIALLPPSRRWDVEFSTYLTQAPRGMTYAWRGVLEGSTEAVNAQRLPNAMVIDLCGSPGRAEGGALVHTARTGEHREWSGKPATPPPAAPVRAVAEPAGRPITVAGAPHQVAPAVPPANYELIPELAVRLAAGKSPSLGGASGSDGRRRTGILIAGLLAACVLPLTAVGIFFRVEVKRLLGLNPDIEQKVADNQRVVANKKNEEKEQAEQESSVERVAQEASVQPKTQVAGPQKNPVPNPALAQNPVEVRKTAPPAQPPVAPVKPSTTVKPLFIRLEEPVSEVAGGSRQLPIRLDAGDSEVQDMRLILGSNRFGQGTPNGVAMKPELVISSKNSELSGAAERSLASFRASSSREIEFRWSPMRPDERREERDDLRDCILKITTTDKGIRYCVLRDEPGSPNDRNEFQARLESGITPRFTYNIYNWDENGIYNDKLPDLRLADCVLQGIGGRTAPELTEKGDGTWIAALDGEPLLSVVLSKPQFVPDAHGGQRLVLITPDDSIPIRRSSRNKTQPQGEKQSGSDGSKRSDVSSLVLMKLFDNDPSNLSIRIRNKENEKIDLESTRNNKQQEDSNINKKIERLSREIQRLKNLEITFNSVINLKIVWIFEGVKLEIAQLDARKLVREAGQQTQRPDRLDAGQQDKQR